MTYPRPTGSTCPKCNAPVVLDQATSTKADHNGEPQETTSVGHYCTNALCENHNEPIDA